MTFMGRAVDISPSPNSMHLFVTTELPRWQLERYECWHGDATRLRDECHTPRLVHSQDRLATICTKLAVDPSDVFLSGYAAACKLLAETGGSPLGLFGWYTSVCPPGVYCPSFDAMVLPLPSGSLITPSVSSSPPLGTHTSWAYRLEQCSPGFFCSGGQRRACPPGHQCPCVPCCCLGLLWLLCACGRVSHASQLMRSGVCLYLPVDAPVDARVCVCACVTFRMARRNPGMGYPDACGVSDTYNTTCFEHGSGTGSGTVEEGMCPLGAACSVPYLPGLPSPPGHYIAPGTNRGSLDACDTGDWCPLGMYNTSAVLCPEAYYCSTPAVLVCLCAVYDSPTPPADQVPAHALRVYVAVWLRVAAGTDAMPLQRHLRIILPRRVVDSDPVPSWQLLWLPSHRARLRPALLLPRRQRRGEDVPCWVLLPYPSDGTGVPTRLLLPRW